MLDLEENNRLIKELNNKLNDIYVHTEFSRAKISVYLKNLMSLDIVEKVASFDTPGTENTMKGIYRISNPYINFWYRFVYPHEAYLNLMDKDKFYEFIVLKLGLSRDKNSEDYWKNLYLQEKETSSLYLSKINLLTYYFRIFYLKFWLIENFFYRRKVYLILIEIMFLKVKLILR